jgi:predicted PurR-regulated permease PerM
MKHIQTWQRSLIIWGCVVLIVASLYLARVVLIPIVMAILLAFILSPLVTRLQRAGLGRIPSVVVTVGLACLLLGGLGFLVLLQVKSLAEEIPNHKEVIIEKIESIQQVGEDSWFERVYNGFAEIGERFTRTKKAPAAKDTPVPVQVQRNDYWGVVQATVGPTLEFLVNVGLVIVLVTFMLIAREDLRNRVIRLSGTRSLANTTKALDDASARISRFLLMQLLVNGTYGLAAAAGLWLIGVPYALLWGFLTAILRYIPYIGPWLGALLPIALTIAVFPGWLPLVLVVLLFVALELVSNNVMEPWLYGRTIGVSEVAVLVAAAFWTWLWGPLGLVLSTPLTACMVVLGRYLPAFEFLDVLLGDKQVLDTHVSYFQRLLARDEDEAADLVEEYAESHSLAEVYDEVLLPAIHMAKVTHDRDEVTDRDLEFFYRATQEVLEDLTPAQPVTAIHREAVFSGKGDEALPLVLGFPARDEGDAMALQMLGHLLDRRRCRYEVLPHTALSGELRERMREEQPAAVCLFTMPPGGLTQLRLTCKRLHGEFPDLKILVGYWKRDQAADALRERFQRAGAHDLATRLTDLRDKLLPLVSVSAAAEEARIQV